MGKYIILDGCLQRSFLEGGYGYSKEKAKEEVESVTPKNPPFMQDLTVPTSEDRRVDDTCHS